ncbi:MAG: tetratricopeptide repeat protein [Proteobacteria bacterium]|nr:tetratricopeptide repeat protein [Pseudomonadota bacterium]
MAQVSLARKKELMEPDELEVFLKRSLERMIQHKTQFTIGVIVFLAIILMVSGLFYYMKNKEMKGSMALAQLISQYEMSSKSANLPTEFFDKFKTFMDTYSGTRSAEFAALRYANICYQEGKYDDAIVFYKKALKQFKKDTALTSIMLCNLGYAYQGKKDYETAKTYFEQVANQNSALLKEDVLFNLGLIYEQTGDKAKMDKSFSQLLSFDKSRNYLDIVKEKISE